MAVALCALLSLLGTVGAVRVLPHSLVDASLLEASSKEGLSGPFTAFVALLAGHRHHLGTPTAPFRARHGGELRAFVGDFPPPVPAIELVQAADVSAMSSPSFLLSDASSMSSTNIKKFMTGNVELIVRPHVPEGDRDLRMMDHLEGMPGVDSYATSTSTDGKLWVLTENVDRSSLHDRLSNLKQAPRAANAPFMPFDESLPILVDLLRAVGSLDAKGVVHMDLTGENAVMLVEDTHGPREKRAILSDLGKSACIASNSDHELSCQSLSKGGAMDEDSLPTGPTLDPTHHNLRQVGLLFAKMVLGTVPANAADGSAPIDLTDDASFRTLKAEHPDVAALLAGILDSNPERRLSHRELITKAGKAMATRNIQRPMDVWVYEEMSDKTDGRLRRADMASMGSTVDSSGTLRLRLVDMGDDGADMLRSSLHTIGGVKRLELNLQGNGLTDDGAEAIGHALDGMDSLEHLALDLEDNSITDLGVGKLSLALFSHHKLHTLEIDLDRNKITDLGAAALARAISMQLQGLEIELGGNKVTDVGIEAIAAGIGKAHKLTTLELEFAGNTITDEGIRALSKSLANAPLKKLELDLRNNRVADPGAHALADRLLASRNLESVEVHLGGNYGVTREGLTSVNRAKDIVSRLHAPSQNENIVEDNSADQLMGMDMGLMDFY